MISHMTVDHAIRLYLRARERREAPPSPSGLQLERQRDGTTQTAGTRGSSLESELIYTHLVHVFEALAEDHDVKLSRLERDALFATQTPKAHAPGCHGHKDPVLRDRHGQPVCPCGAVAYVERIAPSGDYVVTMRVGDQDVRTTKRGEFYVRPSDEVDMDVVEGIQPIYPTAEEAAETLGISRRTFFRLLRTARAKVAARLTAM